MAVNDGWVTDGPNFGSNNVVVHNAPKVAIAWDEPTSRYSPGNTRYVIERVFDYPVTAIRSDRLGTADLDRYQVLILPATGESDYSATFGEEGVQNLRNWVASGGVLIGLGTANRFLADPEVDLISIRRDNAVVEEQGDDASDEQTSGVEEEPEPEPEPAPVGDEDAGIMIAGSTSAETLSVDVISRRSTRRGSSPTTCPPGRLR